MVVKSLVFGYARGKFGSLTSYFSFRRILVVVSRTIQLTADGDIDTCYVIRITAPDPLVKVQRAAKSDSRATENRSLVRVLKTTVSCQRITNCVEY